MSSEYKFSAYFKLYSPDGSQVTFGVADNDGHEHLTALANYMADLARLGYLAQLPGLEDGEKIEECDAYVIGETSKGDACLFCYSASHQLQFKVATIYVEKFGELPFAVSRTVKQWDASAAPQREEAEKKGYLVTVPAFKIVLEQRGVTDDGKPQYRFSRVHGAAKPAAVEKPPAPSPAAQADKKFAELPSAQDTKPCTEAQRKAIWTLWTKLYGKDKDGDLRAWIKKLYQVEHTTDLTIAQASAIIETLKAQERQPA